MTTLYAEQTSTSLLHKSMATRKSSKSNAAAQGPSARSRQGKARPTREAARRASSAVQQEAQDVDPLVLPTHEEIVPRSAPASNRPKKIHRDGHRGSATQVRADHGDDEVQVEPVVVVEEGRDDINDGAVGKPDAKMLNTPAQGKKIQTVVNFPKKQPSVPVLDECARIPANNNTDERRAPDVPDGRRKPDEQIEEVPKDADRNYSQVGRDIRARPLPEHTEIRSAPSTPTTQGRSRTLKSSLGNTPACSQLRSPGTVDRVAGKVRGRSPSAHGQEHDGNNNSSNRRVRPRGASPVTLQNKVRMSKEKVSRMSPAVQLGNGAPLRKGSCQVPSRAASPLNVASQNAVKAGPGKGTGKGRREVLLRSPSVHGGTRCAPAPTISKGSSRTGSRQHHEERASQQSQGAMKLTGARQKTLTKFREDNSHSTTKVDNSVLREVRIVFRTVEELKKKVESMEGTLNDIRAALQSNVGPLGVKPPVSNDQKGGIEKYADIMKKHAPYILSYFPSELWQEAIFSATVNLVCRNCAEEMLSFKELHDIISIIMFSLYKKKKSEAFQEPTGVKVSDYRHSILLEAFKLARARKYPPDIPTDFQGVLDDPPYWLQSDDDKSFITVTHMKNGQMRVEKCMSNTADYHTRVKIGNGKQKPVDGDIATFICATLHKHLSDSFRLKRRRVMEDFSETFGYLLAPWAPIKEVAVDEASLDMRWFVPFNNMIIEAKTNLPTTLESSTKEWNHLRRNQELYNNMIARKELMLWVSHDCTVKEEDDDDEHEDEGDRETATSVQCFPHVINMTTPVIAILKACSGYSDKHSFPQLLRINVDSLRALYLLSIGFRDAVTVLANPAICDGLRTTQACVVPCSSKERKHVVEIMEMILASGTAMARAVKTSTMGVSRSEYNRKLMTREMAAKSNDEDSSNENEKDEGRASEDHNTNRVDDSDIDEPERGTQSERDDDDSDSPLGTQLLRGTSDVDDCDGRASMSSDSDEDEEDGDQDINHMPRRYKKGKQKVPTVVARQQKENEHEHDAPHGAHHERNGHAEQRQVTRRSDGTHNVETPEDGDRSGLNQSEHDNTGEGGQPSSKAPRLTRVKGNNLNGGDERDTNAPPGKDARHMRVHAEEERGRGELDTHAQSAKGSRQARVDDHDGNDEDSVDRKFQEMAMAKVRSLDVSISPDVEIDGGEPCGD